MKSLVLLSMIALTGCSTDAQQPLGYPQSPQVSPQVTHSVMDLSTPSTGLSTATPIPIASPSPSPAAKASQTVSPYEQYATREQPVNDAVSEVVTSGEHGQVSTIVGNGTAGQGTYTVDHPRFPASDSKSNVYFIDGSQKKAKLRMWDGAKNTTIADLRENKVTSRDGEFFSTGLQIISDKVYLSSEERVYQLVGARVTELQEIKKWMKDNQYEYVFRMEQYKGDLILMLWRKNWTYAFVKYHPSDKSIEEVLPAAAYPSPTNFFMQERGISVSSSTGAVYYEKFFPRKSIDQVNTNQGPILDTWIDENEDIYFVLNKDKVRYEIFRLPQGAKKLGDEELVAGSIQGFTDGVADEVKMDNPMDFTWDGTGYIFADVGNNAIRKLWLDSKPLSLVN